MGTPTLSPAGVAATARVHPVRGCTLSAGERGTRLWLRTAWSASAPRWAPGGAAPQRCGRRLGGDRPGHGAVGAGVRIGGRCVMHGGARLGFPTGPPRRPRTVCLKRPPSAASWWGTGLVEIGPNAVIEDGETRPTAIADGVRIGALVMIGTTARSAPAASWSAWPVACRSARRHADGPGRRQQPRADRRPRDGIRQKRRAQSRPPTTPATWATRPGPRPVGPGTGQAAPQHTPAPRASARGPKAPEPQPSGSARIIPICALQMVSTGRPRAAPIGGSMCGCRGLFGCALWSVSWGELRH